MSNLKLNLIALNNFAKQRQLVHYGFSDTKYGKCLIGIVENALCYLSFCDDENEALEKFKHLLPKATFTIDQEACSKLAESVFQETCHDLNVSMIGTDFQMDVWKELTKIESGSTKSYEDIARAIKRPTSIRAVANAIAHNNIAYVIPCHRVIRKNGKMAHKSRWGMDRKQLMLKHECVVLNA